MFHNHIGVLCLQKAHRTVSEHYITDGGFLLILSGEEDGCFAGVGFIVAPHCRRCVVSFCTESCRQASLKLRVLGGKMVICSLYAPHSGKPFDERETFFSSSCKVDEFTFSSWSHAGVGWFQPDFTKCMRANRIWLAHTFLATRMRISMPNPISLLLEMCESLGLFVANSSFDLPVENKSPCTMSARRQQHKIFECRLMHGYFPGFTSLFNHCGDWRGVAKKLLPQQLVTHGIICLNFSVLARHLFLRLPSMNACYNVIMNMGLQMNYVLPWRPRFGGALSVVCINEKRANPGQAAAHCICWRRGRKLEHHATVTQPSLGENVAWSSQTIREDGSIAMAGRPLEDGRLEWNVPIA